MLNAQHLKTPGVPVSKSRVPALPFRVQQPDLVRRLVVQPAFSARLTYEAGKKVIISFQRHGRRDAGWPRGSKMSENLLVTIRPATTSSRVAVVDHPNNSRVEGLSYRHHSTAHIYQSASFVLESIKPHNEKNVSSSCSTGTMTTFFLLKKRLLVCENPEEIQIVSSECEA